MKSFDGGNSISSDYHYVLLLPIVASAVDNDTVP